MSKKSTRLEALQNVFEENGISSDSIEWNDDIIMIVFFAVLANANEWGEIAAAINAATIRKIYKHDFPEIARKI